MPDLSMAAMTRPGLRVLAAEDNAINRQVLSCILDLIGARADVVTDGAQAVAACRVAAYDLILMDIQMPVMDGLTAAKVIRAEEVRTGLAPTPIIAVTANADPSDALRYRAAGMDAVVAKPIQLASFLRTVEEVLVKAGAQRPATVGRAESAA